MYGVMVVPTLPSTLATGLVVSPAGMELPVPATDPLPLVRPWHSTQVVTPEATPVWNETEVLQAEGEVPAARFLSSAVWQIEQSLVPTQVEAWLMYCLTIWDASTELAIVLEGTSEAWQSMQAAGWVVEVSLE